MPRPRRAGTIQAEERLAARILTEMRTLGWSYGQVAAAMKREGCDIAAASLYKSLVPHENSLGELRRRPFYVNELVALAGAFRIPVEDLLGGNSRMNRQIAKAMDERDRANRLLEAAVKTMLDADIGLLRAVEHASDKDQAQALDDANRYWRDSARTMQLTPRGAGSDAVQISSEAVADRLAALKEAIADIAAEWHQRERVRRRNGMVPSWPEVGSRSWHGNLLAEREWRDVPDFEDIVALAEQAHGTQQDEASPTAP